MRPYDFGIIGCGKMGGAIARCLSGQYTVCVYDPNPAAAQSGLTVLPLEDLCSQSQAVVVAVKPDVMPQVMPAVSAAAPSGLPVISVAAGWTTQRLQAGLKNGVALRCMPNTPAQIGCGVVALSRATALDPERCQQIAQAFAALGEVVWVEEKQMDAVTAVSGSGPAYVYMFIESLIDAGLRCGLPFALARTLAEQTVYGSAAMCKQSQDHPAVLRAAVCSPGGTTIAGVAALEQHGMRNAVHQAVDAAAKRAAELGEGKA